MEIKNLNLLINYQEFFLKETKDKIKQICKEKNYHFLFYSIDNNNYFQMIRKISGELYTSSFFYDKKVLFIENLSIIFWKKKINIDFLLDFFKNPQKNIIIYIHEEKNNFPTELRKKIYPFFDITKQNKFSFKHLFDYTKDSFEKDGFKIKNSIITFLIKKTNNDLFLLKEEIQKNKIYNYESKNIQDISITEKLFASSQEQNIFLLINAIINNNKETNNLELFEKLINKKESPFFIIYQILNKLEQIINIKYLINKKKTNNQISEILKYSPQKTFYLINEAKLASTEKIQNLFLILFDLYHQMKKGTINPIDGFKNFLIKQIINI
ncbi:DNA polymerase III subunit delta [Candidatus Phytoplasma luffae]|uniref:DNA-directed DNA polymerase n=1 Tax=Loofah witches'-broom phytoplasma TaxID=35773 RepID=A0A975FKD1_LOWBP|nr:DNA polymerase III subunit delta [Candidatus Phytoplasma luffae]QTX02888.1 DNA polymerase III subunit delta [Candidatus Phytoplasma luffae]QTX03013.1 DNA polymerase III subunit delta [Candidatus Phytoplasma luffae]